MHPKLHTTIPAAVLPGARAGLHPRGGHSDVPGLAAEVLVLILGVVCALVLGIRLTQISRPDLPQWPQPRSAQQPPAITIHGPRFERQDSLTPGLASPRRISLEREIAELGARRPAYTEPLQKRYLESENLYRLMQELMPEAWAGDRASQYYIYLVLGQCQTYLRLDAEGAQAVNEGVLLSLNERPVEERLQWQSDYQRCRGFAGGDLGPLRAAMGEDTPGAEVEYASIWFQRALESGYPAALAEAALRINLLALEERKSLLEEAVSSGDPEVYWQLFHNSPGEGAEAITPRGLAWLIMACRAGSDCTRNAEWFRAAVCLQEDANCAPGESALEHYWYALPAYKREQAYALADRIEQDLAEGRMQNLPWPSLSSRNIVENRS